MRQKLFNNLAILSIRFPAAVIAVAIALAAISAVYAVRTIRLNANLDDLVSMKLDYHRRYIDFLKEFGDEEYLYVVVDAGKDMPAAKRFVAELGGRLKEMPDLKQVIWKIENPALEKNFLLYLTDDQLKSLKAMTTAGPFAVKNIASWDGFAPLFGALATRIGEPVTKDDEAELTTGFTFIDGLLDDMSASLAADVPYKSRLQSLFFGGGETFDPDGFYRNGDLLFLLIMPSKDFSTMEVIAKPLADIRAAIDETKKNYPGLDAGLTGRPVLSADEMITSNQDTTRATIIAVIIEAILLIIFFKNASRPIFSVAALLIGVAWTFGFAALAYGTLNILSMVFAIILVSTAIEYCIQIVARYQETLAETGDVAESIRRSLTKTGMAVLTSALTTAAAFLTVVWTDFTALAQLGVIAASGIMLCLASAFIVLPAMLVIWDRRKGETELRNIHPFKMPRIEVIYKRPVLLLSASLVATVAIALFAGRVSFDNNLLNLQAKGIESVKYEDLIIEKSSETTWFARAVTDTIPKSHELAAAFRKLPSVRSVDDVERILPEDQAKKIEFVKGMAPAFDGVSFQPVSTGLNARLLMFELGRLASNLERLQEEAFSSGRADAVDELDKFAGKVRKLVGEMDSADDTKLSRLGVFQKDFFADLQKNLEILATGMNPSEISLADLPADVRGRFVSPQGRYALFIYPKENIWDPPALERFVNEIRSVDPNVLGTPIEVHESGRLMRDTFNRSAVLAIIVIIFLCAIDFKSLRCTFLAVLPLVVGTLWLLGAMGFLGIPFNMANFFAIPILIGIGIDFGVNVMHRIRQENSFAAISSSMGKGLLLTALANFAGFGAMAFAHHRGIASLGKIMAIGCIFCFVASVVVMPPVAKFLNWGHSRCK